MMGIIKLFPPRQSLVIDIPAGDGNVANLFYGVVFVFIVEAKNLLLISFWCKFQSAHEMALSELDLQEMPQDDSSALIEINRRASTSAYQVGTAR